jgi:hypothetical protein
VAPQPLVEATPEALHAQAAEFWKDTSPEDYAAAHARFKPESKEEAEAYAAAVNDRTRSPHDPLPPASADWKTSMEKVMDGEMDIHIYARAMSGDMSGLSQADADRIYAIMVRDDEINSLRQAEADADRKAFDAEIAERTHLPHDPLDAQPHPVVEATTTDHSDMLVHEAVHDEMAQAVVHESAADGSHATDQ